ncbi:unnamed protein product [Spirodela intermedia]|uniref:tRNA-binding domain-containing protein n=1 Tax=Spirodela intermedia TaxID=51605 RepID=A0A7I8KE50_SPIIN|nr:unnamed protein product [Spirodela intermedia]
MPAAVVPALLSRGGSGAFVLSSAFSRRRSPALPAAALYPFARPLSALLFPSRPCGRRDLQIRCMASSPEETASSSGGTILAVEEGAAAAPLAADPAREAAGLLDIRVGRVLRAWRHPEAESLFVEEVDVGEAEPRTICSGLDARVLVLANLKPRNMRGIKSNGMLLAASDEAHEKVELLVAQEGTVPGERVWFGAEDDKDRQPEPATPNQVQKKKIWESVQAQLKTNEEYVAVLGELPMLTSQGPVVCASLKNARIS